MNIRNLFLSLTLTAFAVPGLAFAQDENRATVLLRNGDRVAGEVEDVNEGVLYVRVSLNDQRKIDVKNVALIDFAGGATGLPETELSAAQGSGHIVLLRGGDSMKGNFVDIRGGEADKQDNNANAVIFRDASGNEQRIAIDKVARIYMGNFPTNTYQSNNAPAADAPAADVPPGAVRVPANQQWVATPLTVKKGDRVSFNVTGEIQLSNDANDKAISAGSKNQRYATGAPLPGNFAGALIAKVGNAAPFPIGNVTTPVTMPADGMLYLGVNDDVVTDNQGAFIVQMNRQPQRR